VATPSPPRPLAAVATNDRGLLAIFFLSGAAGLVYQVLWVRQLSLVVGVTTFAMAAVVATFMGGLALGSALSGRLADRVRSPLTIYGLLELAVAGSALLVPLMLRAAGALHHAWLPNDAPWTLTVGVELLIAAAVLLVPTTCMGATLPLLSRHVARSVETRGRDLGRLYSVNTLGAFVGTVLAGFLAIELLGIAWTTRVAAGLNLAAAAVALFLGRQRAPTPAPLQGRPAPSTDGGWSSRGILALAAASGFLALGYEVAWTRLMGLVLLTTTYTYTTILATVIGGIGIGSWIGARVTDRVRSPEGWFGLLQLGIGATALLVFPLLTLALRAPGEVLTTQSLPFGRGQGLGILICAAVMAPPAILMGCGYPALARAATRAAGEVGLRISRLYAVNTLGAIAGAVVVGFLLLPVAGVLTTLHLLVLGSLVLGAVAAWPRPGSSVAHRRAMAVCLAAAAVVGLLGARHASVRDLYEARLPAGSKILHLSEGLTSTVMVADHAVPPVRRIWIQSCWVAGTGGTQKMLGHLSMLHAVPTPAVIGIAFGTGQSFGSATLYAPRELTCVDLDRGVVEAGGRWFSEHNHDLLRQPQVRVRIQDGRRYLAGVQQPVDAILIEPLQPWSAGAVNLYTTEFYETARSALADGGVVTQWLPLDDIPASMSRSVVRTFTDVFPGTYLYLDNYDLWIVGVQGEGRPDLTRWQARLADPAIHQELDAIGYPDLHSVLATLVAGPEQAAAFGGDAPPLTDDRPFMEFQAPRSMVGGEHLEDNLTALAGICQDPLSTFETSAGPLPEALRSGATARSLAEGLVAQQQGRDGDADALYADALRAAPTVGRLRWMYRRATQRHASALDAAGQRTRAKQVYLDHLELDPDFAGGWLNLGLLYAMDGQPEEAVAALGRARNDAETRERAEAALELLGVGGRPEG